MLITVWFGDIRKAKTAAVIIGALAAVLLVAAAVTFALKFNKIQKYEHVEATVTAFDTRDGNNVWTEFVYSVGGKPYTARLKGHSYWMRIDSMIDLIVNPNDPNHAEVLYGNPYTVSVILLAATGLFGLFFLLYLINFLVLRKKQRSEFALLK